MGIMRITIHRFGAAPFDAEVRDGIDLAYRADGRKGADDGGVIRQACKASCERIEYDVSCISARLIGLDALGCSFIAACPDDCIVEIIGGHPAIYQAEIIAPGATIPSHNPTYTVNGTEFHGGKCYGETDNIEEVVRMMGQHAVRGCDCGCVVVKKGDLIDGLDFDLIADIQAAGISENQYQHLLQQGRRRGTREAARRI